MKDGKRDKPPPRWALTLLLAFLPAALVVAAAEAAAASGGGGRPEVSWQSSPGTFDLGKDLARIEVGPGYLFADGENARKVMSALGNPPTDRELGLILPANDNAGWFLIFERYDVGYVKDDDKDKIDADAILESIRKGTEEGNKYRKERGIPSLTVLGWQEKPHYDEKTHHLVWATLARQEAQEREPQNVNYNIRLLGRHGYVSAVLVADTQTLRLAKPEADALVARFGYVKGQSYAEFVKGDKVAAYGLTALIAGGAGAAAVKTGLLGAIGKFLAKMWKVVVAGVIALGAGVKKLFSARRREGGKITPA